MSAVLADLGVDVVACSDVFGALARLHRSDRSQFGAVLVCVDYLAAGEFEFFALVGRAHDDLGVLAYSAAGRGGRVRRAVSLGATGALEADRASVTAVLGNGDAVAETASEDVAVDSLPTSTGEDHEEEADGTGVESGPLLTEEEIRMLLSGDGEAEAVGRRRGMV